MGNRMQDSTTIYKDLVEKARRYRLEYPMTQKELAAKMGKRESEISKWLTGRHNFTTKTLASISLALGEPIINVVSE